MEISSLWDFEYQENMKYFGQSLYRAYHQLKQKVTGIFVSGVEIYHFLSEGRKKKTGFVFK
jgi:hypothetical protein